MKGQERVINPQTNWMKSVAIFSVCPEGTYGAGCSQNCTCNTLNTALCNSTTGACVCKAGWEGEKCSDDVDECNTSPASHTVCPDHSVCTNTNGSFLCLCLKEFYKSQSLCLGKDKFVLTLYPVILLSLSSSSSSLIFTLLLSYSSASKQSETKLTASKSETRPKHKSVKRTLICFQLLSHSLASTSPSLDHFSHSPLHQVYFPTVPFTRSVFPQSASPDHLSHSPHWISLPTVPVTGSFPTVPLTGSLPTVPVTGSLFPQSPSSDHFSHSPPHWISSHSPPHWISFHSPPHQICFPTVHLTRSVSPQSPSPDLFPQSTSPDHFSHSVLVGDWHFGK